jgi:hypothetical protein
MPGKGQSGTDKLMSGALAKNEPQMNADEGRFIVPGLYQRRTGSLRAQGMGLRQWRRSERRGWLYLDSRRAQEGGVLRHVLYIPKSVAFDSYLFVKAPGAIIPFP